MNKRNTYLHIQSHQTMNRRFAFLKTIDRLLKGNKY